jgi:hypothetical protein
LLLEPCFHWFRLHRLQKYVRWGWTTSHVQGRHFFLLEILYTGGFRGQ